MRKNHITFMIPVGFCAAAICLVMKRPDEHYSAERRAWKDRAVEEIRSDLKTTDYLQKRFGKIPEPTDGIYSPQSEWKTTDTILCGDSSWLAYRSHCRKEGAEVYDFFIAKGSDGKWYYSDYHFCVGMMMLESRPLTLEQFKYQFFLKDFDGKSDEALAPTWVPVGTRRAEDDPSSF